MSLFKAKRSGIALLACIAVIATLLHGCGFSPLYGKTAATQGGSVFNSIAISNIPDHYGVTLRNHLLDVFYTTGKPQNPAYDLKVFAIKKSVTSLGVRRDATSTRGQMEMTVDIDLVDSKTGKSAFTRTISASGDFDKLNNQYATLVNEQSVTDNLLQDLGDSIKTEVALYFARQSDASLTTTP